MSKRSRPGSPRPSHPLADVQRSEGVTDTHEPRRGLGAALQARARGRSSSRSRSPPYNVESAPTRRSALSFCTPVDSERRSRHHQAPRSAQRASFALARPP